MRIPKLFVILCLCVGIVTWVGMNSGRHQGPMVVPTISSPDDEPPLEEASVGNKAPDFTLLDVTGSYHSLSSYEGRPVLLYFWASWCPYCLEGMPDLNLLKEHYAKDNLVILAVNILEEKKQVTDAARTISPDYPLLLDETGRVTRSYLVRAIPTVIFIDPDGVYQDVVIGTPRPGVMQSKIESILRNL